MLHHVFLQPEYADYRQQLAAANTFEEMENMTKSLHSGLSLIYEKSYKKESPLTMEGLLALPFWRLKPYVRPKPTREIKKRKTESLEQKKKNETLEKKKKKKKKK